MTVHRVVFDSSTLVSAALRLDSIPHQALLRAVRFCDLCASEATLDELKEVLAREKFRRYLPGAARQKFLHRIENRTGTASRGGPGRRGTPGDGRFGFAFPLFLFCWQVGRRYVVRLVARYPLKTRAQAASCACQAADS
jgi:hypothetical protein